MHERGVMKLTSFLAELIGTFIVVLIGTGVAGGILLKGTKSQGSGWMNLTVGWGLGYTIGIFTVYQYSGAHLNPAYSIGLATIGEFSWSNVPQYVSGQIIGALFAAIIVFLLYLPQWKKTGDENRILNVFVTSPAINHSPINLFNEITGTFLFVFGILIIRSNEVTSTMEPILIGLLVMAVGLSIGGTTGFAINPARDLGPRIAHYLLPIIGKGKTEWGYAWIPITGPIVGGVFGALFYQAFYLGRFSNGFWLITILIGLVVIWAIIYELVINRKK